MLERWEMRDVRCMGAAAVPDKHPGQMGLDIPASHDCEGNMGPRFKSISDSNSDSRNRSPICDAG